mmetsp:Transcript_28240/g.77541  ORF Transcript_28240/g.77541 Transcript_28240/m.77541 type:complete len:236 (+) Transcript_28240:35-742(+)
MKPTRNQSEMKSRPRFQGPLARLRRSLSSRKVIASSFTSPSTTTRQPFPSKQGRASGIRGSTQRSKSQGDRHASLPKLPELYEEEEDTSTNDTTTTITSHDNMAQNCLNDDWLGGFLSKGYKERVRQPSQESLHLDFSCLEVYAKDKNQDDDDDQSETSSPNVGDSCPRINSLDRRLRGATVVAPLSSSLCNATATSSTTPVLPGLDRRCHHHPGHKSSSRRFRCRRRSTQSLAF